MVFKNIVLLIVGNKSDMVKLLYGNMQDVEMYVELIGVIYFVIFVKFNVGIEEIFMDIVCCVM